MDLQVMNKLDYNLHTDVQRTAHIHNLLTPQVTEAAQIALSQNDAAAAKQLEGLANFILFGKDASKFDTNMVQRKEIAIDTKKKTYTRTPPVSLDELMENPVFDEGRVREMKKSTYTNPKPKIARPTYNELGEVMDEGDSSIPGMVQLWDSIDYLERQVELWHGAAPEEGEHVPEGWTSYNLYKMKHWIIELKQQQYMLKKIFNPPMPHFHQPPTYPAIDWEADSWYWRPIRNEEGVGLSEQVKRDSSLFDYRNSGILIKHVVRRHTIDLTDPNHIYWLLEYYDALKKSSWEDLNGQMKYILFDLETLDERAGLSAAQYDILELKVQKWTNERIKDYLHEHHGLVYNVNYISTIYKRNICEKLALSATIMYKEHVNRDRPAAWKVCSCCGERLLRDPIFFVKKSTSVDGLAARCKACDKKIRDSSKGGNNGTDKQNVEM